MYLGINRYLNLQLLLDVFMFILFAMLIWESSI